VAAAASRLQKTLAAQQLQQQCLELVVDVVRGQQPLAAPQATAESSVTRVTGDGLE
jgi:hypothetical protein